MQTSATSSEKSTAVVHLPHEVADLCHGGIPERGCREPTTWAYNVTIANHWAGERGEELRGTGQRAGRETMLWNVNYKAHDPLSFLLQDH
jgi:hypothetical protein